MQQHPEKRLDYDQESVLIVDDNELVRDTLFRLLESLGFSVDAVSSGPQALEEMNDKSYSFLLTDMKMPEMDGMELIRTSRDLYPDLSIISMTGYSEGYRYVDVINAGASDFIKKPFDIEELEAKIRRILNERVLREELNRLSITDSLTGLYNHRQFFLRLKEEVLRARRQKQDLSVVLVDLDDFKAFNDTHGHLAGDEILRDVGDIIRHCIREGVDTGCRYGGDEFSIILIDANQDAAQTITNRLEQSFEDYGKIMASFGSAQLHGEMTELDLVDAADQDLYRDKQKNKVARDKVR